MSSQAAFQVRDLPQALEFADRSLALNPEFWIGHMQRAQALVELRDYEQASAALASAITSAPWPHSTPPTPSAMCT